MRQADDYYSTPDWCADIGARIARQHGPIALDPCAGTGALMRAVERAGGAALGLELDTDRARAAGAVQGNALHVAWPHCQVIIMNPPFCDWQPFVQRALTANPSGVVVLLRLGALAGQRRRDWWRSVADRHGVTVHVLSRRPSFTRRGTDYADYCWLELSRNRNQTGVVWT